MDVVDEESEVRRPKLEYRTDDFVPRAEFVLVRRGDGVVLRDTARVVGCESVLGYDVRLRWVRRETKTHEEQLSN